VKAGLPLDVFTIPFGAWPILLTPFHADGSIDYDGLEDVLSFYINHHVPGMLALGQASEVLTLEYNECFEIARRLARICTGQLRTVAVGNFGANHEAQIQSLTAMAAVGIDVPVVALSLLPESSCLADQLLFLAEKVDSSIPLGIYELPEPEHRILTADDVRRVAQSERYVFMKDTCRQIELFTAKVQAAKGTPLKIFQANFQILLESLQAGCHGFCGHMAMIAPELIQQICDPTTAPEFRLKCFYKLLEFQAVLRAHGFPASAKYILQRLGVKVEPLSRVEAEVNFTQQNRAALDAYFAAQDCIAPRGS
jgi:4-hydroxy-tetrahydrodipicolinate synthase